MVAVVPAEYVAQFSHCSLARHVRSRNDTDVIEHLIKVQSFVQLLVPPPHLSTLSDCVICQNSYYSREIRTILKEI